MTDVLVKRIHFCVVLFDFQNLPGWNSPRWKPFCLVSTAGSSCNFYTNFLCVSSVPCSNFIEFQALDLQICSSKGVVLRAYQLCTITLAEVEQTTVDEFSFTIGVIVLHCLVKVNILATGLSGVLCLLSHFWRKKPERC